MAEDGLEQLSKKAENCLDAFDERLGVTSGEAAELKGGNWASSCRSPLANNEDLADHDGQQAILEGGMDARRTPAAARTLDQIAAIEAAR